VGASQKERSFTVFNRGEWTTLERGGRRNQKGSEGGKKIQHDLNARGGGGGGAQGGGGRGGGGGAWGWSGGLLMTTGGLRRNYASWGGQTAEAFESKKHGKNKRPVY